MMQDPYLCRYRWEAAHGCDFRALWLQGLPCPVIEQFAFPQGEAKVSIEHENRSRSTSLTSAPESEGDQPQIETLVVQPASLR
jgi:hypothetical protein